MTETKDAENGTYPFELIPKDSRQPAYAPEKWLLKRPFSEHDFSLKEQAKFYEPGGPLTSAMNVAIAVGQPLLLTGDPGMGKTQAAYYAALKLETEIFRFQVKSESTAKDLLYHFNTMKYFYDAQYQKARQGEDRNPAAGPSEKPAAAPREPGGESAGSQTPVERKYVEKRQLWEAFEYGERKGRPAVLLIDEIDKAPRDFPNDLLRELDEMKFTIAETQETIEPKKGLHPVVFITSNSERRLPDPFLRRCVYHHIRFDETILWTAVEKRKKLFEGLPDELVKLAVNRFLELRKMPTRKKPATGELLVWLRVLKMALNVPGENVEEKLRAADLSQAPYLGVLLKDRRDLSEISGGAD